MASDEHKTAMQNLMHDELRLWCEWTGLEFRDPSAVLTRVSKKPVVHRSPMDAYRIRYLCDFIKRYEALQ